MRQSDVQTAWSVLGRALKDACRSVDLLIDVRRHLRTLRILGDGDEGCVSVLDVSALLLSVDADAFVDTVMELAALNPCLSAALIATQDTPMQMQAGGERDALLRSAVAYAVMLDRLTRQMRADWRVFETVTAHWRAAQQGVTLKLSLFGHVKQRQLSYFALSTIDRQRRGEVEPDFMHMQVPMNVMEAVLWEVGVGGFDNARAGLSLLAGSASGQPASRLAQDRNAIIVQPCFAIEWIDLYVSWNLAFCGLWPRAPYFFAKILTPLVLDFRAEPGLFLYQRGIALWTHGQHEIFRRIDGRGGAKGREPDEGEAAWCEPAVRAAWGRSNRTQAQAYTRVRKTTATDPQRA